MYVKRDREKMKQVQFLCLEDMVPSEHMLRDIDSGIDWSFIYKEAEGLYKEEIWGKPGIDPVSLIKIVILQYIYGIPSMRQTIREIEVNAAYRWFIGYDIAEKVPHFTTFGKNYTRRFEGTGVFERIFAQILQEAGNCGFIDASAVFIDGTHIKASANKKKQIIDSNKVPCTPYKRPMTKAGFFKKYEYAYDEYYDCYVCPNNQALKYSTTNREGYREYKSDPDICATCQHRAQCTESKACQKLVTRHVWADYMALAEDYRHTPKYKEIYGRRKETIERVFADAKEKHGMRYKRLRGLQKVSMQVALTFACMNLNRLRCKSLRSLAVQAVACTALVQNPRGIKAQNKY